MTLAFSSAALAVVAILAQLAGPTAPPRVTSVSDELGPATWAMLVPHAWLAAPAPRLRHGDALDLLAVRQGDRALVTPIAYGITVLLADERGILVEVDANDASAIAAARGSGSLLIALLRSTR